MKITGQSQKPKRKLRGFAFLSYLKKESKNTTVCGDNTRIALLAQNFALTIQGLLCFPMNVRIDFSISVKK
jgi:hypothetical protein